MTDRKNSCKTESTFIVQVKEKSNYSCQGVIRWVEGNKSIPFRSTLELLHLINSTMEQE